MTGRAAVRQVLKHPHPCVQVACAGFCDHLGREEDVPVLSDLLDEPVPFVGIRRSARRRVSTASQPRSRPT